MSKHTPGPWKWVKEDGYYVLKTAAGRFVADDGSAQGKFTPSFDLEYGGESAANAHLIAASPALLEALKETVKVLSAIVKDDGLSPDSWAGEAVVKARAAIAKAEGAP